MFSENMHTDIQEEGQKRSFRSTKAAIRTTNENWGCEMCIIGQFITNPIEQEKLNMKNKNQFMFQNGG